MSRCISLSGLQNYLKKKKKAKNHLEGKNSNSPKMNKYVWKTK